MYVYAIPLERIGAIMYLDLKRWKRQEAVLLIHLFSPAILSASSIILA